MDNLAQQITKVFPLDSKSLQEIQSEEDLFLVLSEYIQELIDTDFSKLVNTLYRIDVSEIKIKKALNLSDIKNANKVIAQLIIEREKQKIKTRAAYKNRKPDN